MQQQIAESQAAITQMVAHYSDRARSGIPDDAEQFIGMDAIQARIEQLALHADTEVASMMPGGAQDPALIEEAKIVDQQVLDRGVSIRTIGLDSIRNDTSSLAYARWLVERGAQVRTRPTLPVRMLIYDGQTALLPLDPAHTSVGALANTAQVLLFEGEDEQARMTAFLERRKH
ncbi:hypothetical protein GCM10023195_10850 [Actinoallomurus liliacearum]|uniref:DUF5753 domain-containing protein n=1 Tax=Actinoallomurus liliacearum TaxID=1080073 RepID=A0ABP8TB98_9ACTN